MSTLDYKSIWGTFAFHLIEKMNAWLFMYFQKARIIAKLIGGFWRLKCHFFMKALLESNCGRYTHRKSKQCFMVIHTMAGYREAFASLSHF